LVEGLALHVRKIKNVEKKKYREKVLAKIGGKNEEPTENENSDSNLDPESAKALKKFKDFGVYLTVFHGCHVKETNSSSESADFIMRFTTSLATAPYKNRISSLGFCTEGVSKSISNSRDFKELWMNQLVQITLVSVDVAKSIILYYPTMNSLMREYKNENKPVLEKQELLRDIPFINSSGVSNRRIGTALSNKIYKVFALLDGTQKIN